MNELDNTEFDEADFVWGDPSKSSGETESTRGVDDLLSRPFSSRKIGAVGVVLLVLTSSTLLFTGGASAALSFTATDVTVTTDDGTVETVTVAPAGTISYQGLETPPSSVKVLVQVKEPGGNWKTIASQQRSAANLSGSVSYDFTATSILANSAWTKADFRAPDGETKNTDVSVRVKAVFTDAGSNGSDVTTASSTTFTVSVTNVAAGGSVGGNTNPNASG